MGLSRVCEELLKSARLAFVKQDWSKAVNDLSEVLNEVRDTDSEVDLAMAPVHILYAFSLLRQIATKEGNPEEKSEAALNGGSAAARNEDAGPSDQAGPSSSSSSSMPGPSSSANVGDELDADEDDDLNELEEPAKSLMIAWEVLLLAKSIFEKFPAKANKLEELHAMQLQAEILFHNNDVQCLVYLDKIVEELKNFPSIVVWPLKVLIMKAAYLLRFKQEDNFFENLNIVNGRLEDAMSEVQQPEGEKLLKVLEQIKVDVKEMLEQEKVENKQPAKLADNDQEGNLLQLNAEEMRSKIESKLLALCSPYALTDEESGTQLSARILDDVNEIIADGIEEENKKVLAAPKQIIESEQIGFGPPDVPNGTSGGSSTLLLRRKTPAPPAPSPEKGKKRAMLTSISTNGNGTHNGSTSDDMEDQEAPMVKRANLD